MSKKRVIKDYESLPEEILHQIKLTYPRGFAQNLVYYTDRNGKRVSALPFDTEEVYYLVRMTVNEAVQIIEDDDDYDSEGVLRDDFIVASTDEDKLFGDEVAVEEDDESSYKFSDDTAEEAGQDEDDYDNIEDADLEEEAEEEY